MDTIDLRRRITLHLVELGWKYKNSKGRWVYVGENLDKVPKYAKDEAVKTRESKTINTSRSNSKPMSGKDTPSTPQIRKKKTIRFTYEGKEYTRTTENAYTHAAIVDSPGRGRRITYHRSLNTALNNSPYRTYATSVKIFEIPKDGEEVKIIRTIVRPDIITPQSKPKVVPKQTPDKPVKKDWFDDYDFRIQQAMYNKLNQNFPTPEGVFQMNGLPFIPLSMDSWGKVMQKLQNHYKEVYLPSIGKDVDTISDEERSSDEIYNQVIEFVKKQMKRDLKKASPRDKEAMEEWLKDQGF